MEVLLETSYLVPFLRHVTSKFEENLQDRYLYTKFSLYFMANLYRINFRNQSNDSYDSKLRQITKPV